MLKTCGASFSHLCAIVTGACLATGGGCLPVGRINAHSGNTDARGSKETQELEELATNVSNAYRNARYVSFEQEVIAPPYRIECTSRMAEGKLDTRLVIDGKLAAIMTLCDGRIEETRLEWAGLPHLPDHILRNVTLSYDAPLVNGTDDLVLREGMDSYLCLVGSNFQSWAGKYSEHALFLRDRILHGRLLESASVNGRPCRVVMWENKIPGYHRRDKFYIDSQTYFWRKWETLTSDSKTEPVLERSRVITKIEILGEIPSGQAWRFSTPEPCGHLVIRVKGKVRI